MAATLDHGSFIISLDFELFWGVRDRRTLKEYGENIRGVRKAIPAMLRLFEQFEVRVTFAAVGLLTFKNREELLQALPAEVPQYHDPRLSPYGSYLDSIGEHEGVDPHHFGAELLTQIRQASQHELGSHTFSHYYCLEPGQSAEEFRADLEAMRLVAERQGLSFRSIVFPRNQYSEESLALCRDVGLEVFRGVQEGWAYRSRSRLREQLLHRAFRFLDAYLPLSGTTCWSYERLQRAPLINVPASRFLQPYSRRLSLFEPLRLRRILNSLEYAAREKQLFHLWWHPHNFGRNLGKNLAFLELVLKRYQELRHQYGLQSMTMGEFGRRLSEQRV